MTLLRTISLVSVLGPVTFAAASNTPKQNLIDNVVRCEPSAGCVNKVIYGRNYKVLTTSRFTVMVSISEEGAYTRADVSVGNNTGTPLSVTPEDFRVEVITPKPRILLYIPPAELKDLPAPQPPKAVSVKFVSATASNSQNPSATLAAASNLTSPTSEIDALYAAQKQKIALEEATYQAASQKDLSATMIAPNEVARGRVYFERDKKAHLVNVVLPVAGVVFEFPYAMKK
jgi:hypothetical protein